MKEISILEKLLFGFGLGLILSILLFGCAFAQEPITVEKSDCQNPDTLTPQMKKAYEQLKELFKDDPDVKISIKCKEK